MILWASLESSVDTEWIISQLLSVTFSCTFVSSEQAEHVSSLEEKLRLVRSSLQEAQLHASQQKQTISELQVKNSQQSVEMDGLRRRIDELQQVRTHQLPSNTQPSGFAMWRHRVR